MSRIERKYIYTEVTGYLQVGDSYKELYRKGVTERGHKKKHYRL